jgi:hypothetical protein
VEEAEGRRGGGGVTPAVGSTLCLEAVPEAVSSVQRVADSTWPNAKVQCDVGQMLERGWRRSIVVEDGSTRARVPLASCTIPTFATFDVTAAQETTSLPVCPSRR